LVARFRQSVKDPQLLEGSIPAALRDEYGADNDVCTDNLIMVIFAGFETTTSLVTGLLYHLAQQEGVLDKVRQ
jgi:cytochrome P450